MNNYILGKKNDGETTVTRAKKYVREKLIESQEEGKGDAAIFRRSLAYQHYEHSLK